MVFDPDITYQRYRYLTIALDLKEWSVSPLLILDHSSCMNQSVYFDGLLEDPPLASSLLPLELLPGYS